MRRTTTILLAALFTHIAAVESSDLVVLRYGEVISDPSTSEEAVATTALIEHLEFLADRGYVPISLEALQDRNLALPERAVLVTFDGGYASFATEVAPLLEVAGVPAVVGVSTGWLDGEVPPPDDRPRLSWDDLRRLIARTPLITIASHGHDLWRRLPSTHHGDLGPAATTCNIDRSETTGERRRRLTLDLEHSAQRLEAELGTTVDTIAWPWGSWDRTAAEAASEVGFKVAMALRPVLDPGRPRTDDVIRRLDVGPAVDAGALEWALHPPALASTVRRSITLDMGALQVDPDPPETVVARLTSRLASLGTTTAVLQLPGRQTSAHDPALVGLTAHLISQLREDSPRRPILVDLRSSGPTATSAEGLAALLSRLRADGVVLPKPPTDDQRASILGTLPDAVLAVPILPRHGDSRDRPTGIDLALVESGDPDALIDHLDQLREDTPHVAVLAGAPGRGSAALVRHVRRLSAAGWKWIGLDATASRVVLEGPYHPASAEISEIRRPREPGPR